MKQSVTTSTSVQYAQRKRRAFRPEVELRYNRLMTLDHVLCIVT